MIRKTVHYEGNVQGVGFRATARSLAERFDVTGYVRNMPDGSVQLVAEGPQDEVDSLLDTVAGKMGSHIRRQRVDQSPPSGEFNNFDVRY